jgi:hypothetical protein
MLIKSDLINLKSNTCTNYFLPFNLDFSFLFKYQATTKSPTIRYINTIEVPFNEEFKNTVIGGRIEKRNKDTDNLKSCHGRREPIQTT